MSDADARADELVDRLLAGGSISRDELTELGLQVLVEETFADWVRLGLLTCENGSYRPTALGHATKVWP